MKPITKKDLTDTLIEFYGKVIEPRFDNIEKKLEEHDKKFADLLNYIEERGNRLKLIS